MSAPVSSIASPELRAAVGRLFDRLGASAVVVEPGWERFARSCGAPPRTAESGQLRRSDGPPWPLLIGPIEGALARMETHCGEFGFVAPSAEVRRPWQPGGSWHGDPTMRLWRAGWSVLDVERITVAVDDGVIEYVIGNARPTPAVSALDDHD